MVRLDSGEVEAAEVDTRVRGGGCGGGGENGVDGGNNGDDNDVGDDGDEVDCGLAKGEGGGVKRQPCCVHTGRAPRTPCVGHVLNKKALTACAACRHGVWPVRRGCCAFSAWQLLRGNAPVGHYDGQLAWWKAGMIQVLGWE